MSDIDGAEPPTKELPPQEVERAREIAGRFSPGWGTEPAPPSSTPTGPVTPVGMRALSSTGMPTESELRNRILSGLSGQYPAAAPAPTLVPAPPPASSGALSDPWASAPTSGSYATSEPPSATGRHVVEERVPIGYVIAFAFFLAVAVVGFGVWLAFAVISL
jgi:hypothetical protein